ncbi:MAG: SDR family oxidoreductase [Rhodospirillaceae bacterium]|nr:SDR family oxidoreductase [Rhodospirillaceae bacterium]
MNIIAKSALAAVVIAALTGTAMAKDTVLVAGATGKSGRAIITSLLDQGYAVRAMVRNPAKATDLGAGVELVTADVTKKETLPAAVKGVDYVISTIGAVPFGADVPEKIDYQGVADLVDAAKAAGVKHFGLMTSMGAGSEDPNEQLNKMFNMILKWKGKGEEHLRKSGLPYTIVRPGGLADCEPGKTGLKVSTMKGTGGGQVCRADAGLTLVEAIKNPAFHGKTFAVVKDDAAPVDGWKKDVAALPKD